jgi:hypothetical protein
MTIHTIPDGFHKIMNDIITDINNTGMCQFNNFKIINFDCIKK